MTNNRGESPIACNLAALEPDQRASHGRRSEALRRALQEFRELPDGYAFRFPVEQWETAAQFVALERLCCPFLDLALVLEREGGPLWLRVTGREGVKAFLRSEFQIERDMPPPCPSS